MNNQLIIKVKFFFLQIWPIIGGTSSFSLTGPKKRLSIMEKFRMQRLSAKAKARKAVEAKAKQKKPPKPARLQRLMPTIQSPWRRSAKANLRAKKRRTAARTGEIVSMDYLENEATIYTYNKGQEYVGKTPFQPPDNNICISILRRRLEKDAVINLRRAQSPYWLDFHGFSGVLLNILKVFFRTCLALCLDLYMVREFRMTYYPRVASVSDDVQPLNNSSILATIGFSILTLACLGLGTVLTFCVTHMPFQQYLPILLLLPFLLPNFFTQILQKRTRHHTFAAALVAVLLFLPMSSSTSFMEKNFVFSTVDKTALNAEHLYVARQYIPCDIKMYLNRLQNIENSHLQLCNTMMANVPEYDSSTWHGSVVKEGVTYLIGKLTSSIRANHLCQSYGGDLVSPRSSHQERIIQEIMEKFSIDKIFAGIFFDEDSNEFYYSSDNKMLNYSYYDQQKLLTDMYVEVNPDWFNIAKRHEDKTPDWYGSTVFLYVIHNSFLRLQFELHSHFATSFKKYGNVKKHNFICRLKAKPALTSPINPSWKMACLRTNANMKKSGSKLISKVVDLLPSSLPQHKTFSPFQTQGRPRRSVSSFVKDSQTMWNELRNSTVMSLETICHNHYQAKFNTSVEDFVDLSHHTSKRSIPALALGASVASPIFLFLYSIFDLIMMNSSPTPTKDEPKIDYDRYVLDKVDSIDSITESIDTSFEKATNFTFVVNSEIKLTEEHSSLSDILEEVYAKLYKSIFFEPEPTDFISKKWTSEVTHYILDNYQIQLNQNPDTYRLVFDYTPNSYVMATGIPLFDKQREISLIKIHALPIFENTTSYSPVSPPRFLAANAERYTILTDDEFQQCLRHRCTSSAPTFLSNVPHCGIDEYYKRDLSTCMYEKRPLNTPVFLTISNTTYFSAPRTNISVTQMCDSSIYETDGRGNSKPISGYGSIEVSPFCTLKVDDVIIQPSVSILTNQRSKPKAYLVMTTPTPKSLFDSLQLQKLRDLDITNIKHNINSSVTTFIDKLKFYAIIASSILGFILILVIMACCCIKCKLARSFCFRFCCFCRRKTIKRDNLNDILDRMPQTPTYEMSPLMKYDLGPQSTPIYQSPSIKRSTIENVPIYATPPKKARSDTPTVEGPVVPPTPTGAHANKSPVYASPPMPPPMPDVNPGSPRPAAPPSTFTFSQKPQK